MAGRIRVLYNFIDLLMLRFQRKGARVLCKPFRKVYRQVLVKSNERKGSQEDLAKQNTRRLELRMCFEVSYRAFQESEQTCSLEKINRELFRKPKMLNLT